MCTFATVKEKNTSPLSKNGEYYKISLLNKLILTQTSESLGILLDNLFNIWQLDRVISKATEGV